MQTHITISGHKTEINSDEVEHKMHCNLVLWTIHMHFEADNKITELDVCLLLLVVLLL
jgi:hypothetical protein